MPSRGSASGARGAPGSRPAPRRSPAKSALRPPVFRRAWPRRPFPIRIPAIRFAFGLPRPRARRGECPAWCGPPPLPTPPPAADVPPLPPLTLMGIAEETTAAGPKRTAVIGGDGDTIYMVTEGQPVGTRYKVTKIGADAIELEDLLTKGYRRIALR